VELLVVIALTTVLFTLIFKPLFDSFNLTSRSGTQIETQQYARDITKQVETLLSNAVFVYDNASTPINLWVTNELGTPQPAPTTFAMLEAVTPARQFDQQPGGTPIDPTTNTPVYAPGSTGSNFALPLSPGRSLVRYFVGLMDNRSIPDNISGKHTNGTPGTMSSGVSRYTPYSNLFENPLAAWDNRATLYRAEVAAYIPDPDDATKYVPNLGLFHTKDGNGNVTDSKTDALELHDPNFFYDNSLAGGDGNTKWAMPGWKDINGDGLVEVWENWKAVSNALINTAKADLITVDRDVNTRSILYDATTGLPSGLGALISFEPAHVQNDPMVPGTIDSAGNESLNSAAVTFSPEHAYWSNPFLVQVYRPIRQDGGIGEYLSKQADALQPDGNGNLNYYQLVSPSKIVRISVAPGNDPPLNPSGLPDVGPNPDPVTGAWQNANPEVAFSVEPKTGLLNFGFSAGVLVHDAAGKPLASYYSPVDVNNGMSSPVGKRYARLDVLPTGLWNGVALNPASAASPLRTLANPSRFDPTPSAPSQYARVRIIPGTERVYGPDQRPGPNYGHRIQYTRVSSTAGVIGLNEYKILYDDVPNARTATNGSIAIDDNNPPANVRLGYIEFNSQPDTTDAAAPNATNGPNSLPVNKTNSSGVVDASLAADPIEVYYNFQMNNVRDVVKGDYLTREEMNIKVDMRLYDPRSARPQSTRLVTKVNVRNLPH